MKKRELVSPAACARSHCAEPACSGNNYQRTPICMRTMYVSAHSIDTTRDTRGGSGQAAPDLDDLTSSGYIEVYHNLEKVVIYLIQFRIFAREQVFLCCLCRIIGTRARLGVHRPAIRSAQSCSTA